MQDSHAEVPPRREVLIEAALAKRNYSPILKRRIEFLLDGHEDRTRLRCCNSGCFICSQELLNIVNEVEAELRT